jgi:hypothetical protein
MEQQSRFNFSLDDAYCEIFYKSTPKFEQARTECLLEDNWLRKNYTPENLIVEEHHGYGVVYKKSTGEPMVMGGLYQDPLYPKDTARMLNRTYIFPKFRSASISGLVLAYRICHQQLIYPLIEENSFSCYFITMQNRDKPSKGWWNVWKLAMDKASDSYWSPADGYIQTKTVDVQKCWQNFVYRGNLTMPTITHEQWLSLPEGN